MGFSCAAMERCVQQNLYHERQMNYRAFAERPSVQQELDEAVEDVEVEPTSGVRLSKLYGAGKPP